MTNLAQRHHWLNTLVGIVDQTFNLTDEERFGVTSVFSTLLNRLQIPERGTPAAMPIPVAQEVAGNYYSNALANASNANYTREVRPASQNDIAVPIDTWREAYIGMFLTAYPNISGEERLLLSKAFQDLFAAIGAPHRAPTHLPDLLFPAIKDSYYT